MLPHVDEFRPVHNLDSMEALCRALAGQRADGDRKDGVSRGMTGSANEPTRGWRGYALG
jgi:hypothetical protein